MCRRLGVRGPHNQVRLSLTRWSLHLLRPTAIFRINPSLAGIGTCGENDPVPEALSRRRNLVFKFIPRSFKKHGYICSITPPTISQCRHGGNSSNNRQRCSRPPTTQQWQRCRHKELEDYRLVCRRETGACQIGGGRRTGGEGDLGGYTRETQIPSLILASDAAAPNTNLTYAHW